MIVSGLILFGLVVAVAVHYNNKAETHDRMDALGWIFTIAIAAALLRALGLL
jgi:hypothetical protein